MRRIIALLLVGAAVALYVRGAVPCAVLPEQPACYVVLQPGPVADTFGLVEVRDAPSYPSTGALLLTTVVVDPEVDLGEWLRASVSDRVRPVRREVVFPPDRSEEDVRRTNVVLMVESQIDAAVAALRALGYGEVEPEPAGAQVVEVLDGSPAETVGLEVGDTIVAVDGVTVDGAEALMAQLADRPVGALVTVTVERGGSRHDAVVELAPSVTEPGRAVLGVIVTTRYRLPVDIHIEAGNIAGPSAGLMFALAVVDLMTPEDLTGGRIIAGTGTIDREGRVGAVGGVQQKIIAAAERAEGPASVFLLPRANFDEARATVVPHRLLLVPVDSLGEALAALEELRADRVPADAYAIGPVDR